jgi:heme/copper-type cytochrome/quinol oxidase subunit 2
MCSAGILCTVGQISMIHGSAADVLHSLTFPTLLIRFDCIPGRLMIGRSLSVYAGVYYGQCSELCGVLHSAMPLSIT